MDDENGKTESWRNTYRGVDLKKWGLYRRDSLVPIHQLPVPGAKLWMGTKETLLVYRNIIFELVVSLQPWYDPLFETQSATHWFLQHLLVRPIVFYNTSNSIKTRLIKWKQGPDGNSILDFETLFSDFLELLRSRRVSWFFARLVCIQSRTNRFLHSVSVAVTIRGTRFEVSGQ